MRLGRRAERLAASVASDGLSASTFCESGTSRESLSMFDSQRSMSRKDLSAIDGGGPMPNVAPFHVQITWFP
jgi:hypothetical protein